MGVIYGAIDPGQDKKRPCCPAGAAAAHRTSCCTLHDPDALTARQLLLMLLASDLTASDAAELQTPQIKCCALLITVRSEVTATPASCDTPTDVKVASVRQRETCVENVKEELNSVECRTTSLVSRQSSSFEVQAAVPGRRRLLRAHCGGVCLERGKVAVPERTSPALYNTQRSFSSAGNFDMNDFISKHHVTKCVTKS